MSLIKYNVGIFSYKNTELINKQHCLLNNMRYETVCFARTFFDSHLFFRIYEQKTQLVIESEGVKCRPTENLKIPSYYQH